MSQPVLASLWPIGSPISSRFDVPAGPTTAVELRCSPISTVS